MYFSKTILHLSFKAITLATVSGTLATGFAAEAPQPPVAKPVVAAEQSEPQMQVYAQTESGMQRPEAQTEVQTKVQTKVQPEAAAAQPVVQIAILLDNSGSMGGLIEQAKSQIWSLVNEFIKAKQHGQAPLLQVAIYTYGDPPPKMLTAFTSNLDSVSEQLFAVTIQGGSEYCGEVIQDAIHELKWTDNPNDLRIIFIAGNEEFTQGPIAYQAACEAASGKDVIVNTIHCGEEIPADWSDAARLGHGKAMGIDQSQAVVYVESPFDKEIADLGGDLNKTYLSYGANGEHALQNQSTQDLNASASSAQSVVQRAVSKANFVYNNAGWDLIDASKDDFSILEKLKPEELPEELRDLSSDEQKAIINAKQEKRSAIQTQINDLNTKRNAYVAEKMKQTGVKDNSLNAAMIKAIHEQAQRKNITFE